jgi:hypothetical protein
MRNTRLNGWPRKFEVAGDYQALKYRELALRVFEFEYAERLTPATPKERLSIIEALRARYYQSDQMAEIQKLHDKENLADLEGWPLDLLQRAAANWRRSNQGYAPRSAGQLTASVSEEFLQRQLMHRKAGDCLRIIGAA